MTFGKIPIDSYPAESCQIAQDFTKIYFIIMQYYKGVTI